MSLTPGVRTPARSRRARLVAALVGLALVVPTATASAARPPTYENPLEPTTTIGTGVVESCADPTVIYGQEGEGKWYMYCTADPLNDEDRDSNGDFIFRQIPMFESVDLVNWTYKGEAFNFADRPAYADNSDTDGDGVAGLWAPEISYFEETGLYHLYYTVTDTTLPGGGSAIGLATSPGPLGPWTHAQEPVIEPHPADCCRPDSRRWVFDPEVERTEVGDLIYYGSYFGGISVRRLLDHGTESEPIEDGDDSSLTLNVGVANKFEGAEVEKIGGYWYLFVSATDCCRGPLTGYVVQVGRSTSPLGPFVDKEGVRLDENEAPNSFEPTDDPTNARVGGTPVIYQNGNRWIGTGHNTVFRDFAGQWWTIYHAVDISDPYFEGAPGFTKRPALLDQLNMVGGWPMLNGGRGPSDDPMPAPAAQPGDKTSKGVRPEPIDRPAARYKDLSDDFRGSLGDQWSWVRQPAAGTYGVTDGRFWMDTQAADLHENQNNASVLVEDAPSGEWVAETKVRLTVPAEGCCFNYTQAGLVIYDDDDNYLRLTHVSIWNTRQTEFGKEVGPTVPERYPRYGNTVVGPPGEWTWLRIVKEAAPDDAPGGLYGGDEAYTAYTSRDGEHWTRGGTWLHHLGSDVQIGLAAMGGGGFRAEFEYVRVSRVNR